MADNTQYYCKRCNRTMDATNFYMSNNFEKYPDNGKMDLCKKCMTAHVDNWDPETYLWILQEVDVPYVPDEWHKLMMKYAKDKSKVTGMTIIGRYLSKMKLKQWKEYRWKDNDFIQEQMNLKLEETMKRQGYDVQEITTAVNKATFEMPTGELREPALPAPVDLASAGNEPDYFDTINGFNEDDLVGDLTDEDKIYLRLKWGKAYKVSEWVELEKLYNEMKASYEINTAGHEDTLKLVCKTSLKANQLLDMGDIDGAQKMIKMYETLMKQGKFNWDYEKLYQLITGVHINK